jgi:hypothetical protein
MTEGLAAAAIHIAVMITVARTAATARSVSAPRLSPPGRAKPGSAQLAA